MKKPTGNGRSYRLYYALRDGKRFMLLLCTASSEELLKAAVKEAEAMPDSWDFYGEFPAAKGKDKK